LTRQTKTARLKMTRLSHSVQVRLEPQMVQAQGKKVKTLA
jgi:hypothetical protein